LVGGGGAKSNASETIGEIEPLKQRLPTLQYSTDASSEWQTLFATILKMWEQAFEQAGNDLPTLEKIARTGADNTKVAIAATEKVLKSKPSAEMHLLLAGYLSGQAWFADAAEKPNLLQRAEKSARAAVQSMKQPTAAAHYRLADILEDEGSYSEAEPNFQRALSLSRGAKDKETEISCLRGLTRTSYALNRRADGAKWFEEIKSSGSANAYDYQSQGERLSGFGDYAESARNYENAATLGGPWDDWCKAGLNYSNGNLPDNLLRVAQMYRERGGPAQFRGYLAWAHNSIANTLNDRGVYEEALSHAREAAALASSDASAYNGMADALYGLHRYQESINAAKQAIRLSDGKYGFMHFRLGAAYFETENWQFARDSFEKAAELDPKDGAAAYNVALCLGRLGLSRDAASWYEEVLRRNPNHKNREEILRTIQNLRR